VPETSTASSLDKPGIQFFSIGKNVFHDNRSPKETSNNEEHQLYYSAFLERQRMTMELIGKQGEELFNDQSWKKLLELALRYGWKPAGAQEPDEEDDLNEEEAFDEEECLQLSVQPMKQSELDPDDPLAQAIKQAVQPVPLHSDDPVIDSYFHNAGFRVTTEDARALANALERSLPDVPNHDALKHKAVTIAGAPGERFLPVDTPVNAFEWFGGQNKRHLLDFIAFCRQGEFIIW
jgi:hypothetical protein